MHHHYLQIANSSDSRLEKTTKTAFRIEGAIRMCDAEEKARLAQAFGKGNMMVQRQRYAPADDYVEEHSSTSLPIQSNS
jgi:hypothetical protein